MKHDQYVVNKQESGTALIDFIAYKLKISKKKSKEMLNSRLVFVNSNRTWMAKHSLKKGDTVDIMSNPSAGRKAHAQILYEDDNYIIVDKKAGILSNGPSSMETVVRDHFNLPSVVAVHRIDRDTTGCLLLARSEEAFKEIIPVFSKRGIRKSYHVIVSGKPKHESQTIEEPIEGKRAVTKIKTLDSNNEASHLLVTIETGRTHQIRKHLSSIGIPVMGDRYYGVHSKLKFKNMKIGRQMLHASGLEYPDPYTGRKTRAKAPLPHDFRKCLKMFRLT